MFVGSGNGNQCKCEDLAFSMYRTSASSKRDKRKTGEVFKTSAKSMRVYRAALGSKRVVRDFQQLTREEGSYTLIRQRFMEFIESFDEEELI